MRIDGLLGYIPSPSTNGISIGPVRLHVYGLLIALGVVLAVLVAQKRWSRIGGKPNQISSLAIWAVPAGLIGARIYSLATSWQVDTGGSVLRAFEIWHGGLGIWGAVLGGVLGGWIGARYMKLPMAPVFDTVAPALPLAQALGRWGNYFNQELFGRPSTLPWAVEISRPHRVPGYTSFATFQPTFLYESIWDICVAGLVLLIERKFRIRRGYLFAVYVALYTFGRFFTEYLRIDDSHRFFGLRLNDWTSIVVCVAAIIVLALKARPKPGDELVGDPLPNLESSSTPDRAPDDPGQPQVAVPPAQGARGQPGPT